MRSNRTDYVHFVTQQLGDVSGLACGRFFGGTGLSTEGVQFAMIMDNALYFAVDDTTRPRYENAGMQCFSYATRRGRVQVRRYFEVPGDVVEDRDALSRWARDSIAIAREGRAP